MASHPRKRVPSGATQHATAGPYSPVIEVDAQRIVVLSGQVAVDDAGTVIGNTIEEQTFKMLDNCRLQLASAGLSLADVFKANVYLADISEWERFNTTYRDQLEAPYPVRTVVQAVLLPGFKVEIELWAVRP